MWRTKQLDESFCFASTVKMNIDCLLEIQSDKFVLEQSFVKQNSALFWERLHLPNDKPLSTYRIHMHI